MKERRVGYVGKRDVAVGAAFSGVVHLESTPSSFVSLCGRRLTQASEPSRILGDPGYVVKRFNICKRCAAKEAPLRNEEEKRPS